MHKYMLQGLMAHDAVVYGGVLTGPKRGRAQLVRSLAHDAQMYNSWDMKV